MTLLSLFKQESDKGPVVLITRRHSFWMGEYVQVVCAGWSWIDYIKPPAEPYSGRKANGYVGKTDRPTSWRGFRLHNAGTRCGSLDATRWDAGIVQLWMDV